MGFLSTPPLTILYSHGNAEDPSGVIGWAKTPPGGAISFGKTETEEMLF